MSEDAVAYVSVVPTFQGGGKAIESQIDGANVGQNIGKSVSGGFLSTVGGIGLGIVKVVGGAVAISGGLIAGLALKGGISRALDIQDAEAKLTGLGHSAKDITEIMNDATKSVTGTAFGLDKAATVAASAVAAGIKPGKDLSQYLTNVADAATIAGVSLDGMGNIFNTVQASGKAYNQQLEQLSQQGIPIYQYLAKELDTTADAVFMLASKGQISSAAFGKAIHDNVGGAALSSGKTARGAWDNVEASLSRLGAAFAGPLIAAAPGLFVAIEGAVDRANKALTPYIAKLDNLLVPAIASLTTWINGIDFGTVVTKIAGFFGSIKDAVTGTSNSIHAGDLSGFFTDIVAVAKPMAPVVVDVAKGLGSIAGSIGQLIGAGIGILPPIINVLAGALGFLRDNSGLIAPLLITIASAMLLYKASQIAANIAALASIPAYTARTAVLLAGLPATLANAAATNVSTAAVEGNTGTLVASAGAWIAAKVATLAGAVATGVATAAQWLFNAALDANPIGIVILAIAALVAAIVFLATKTTFFQTVWKQMVAVAGAVFSFLWTNVVRPTAQFFVDAFNNIVHVVQLFNSIAGSVFGAVGSVVKGAFSGVVSFVRGIFNSITGLVNGIIDGINSATSVAGVIGIHIGKIPHLPRLAAGAVVSPTPGGTAVTIGEGRWPEAVVPLSPKVLDQIGGSGPGKGINAPITIYEATNATAVGQSIVHHLVALGA
ncbi:MAG TPA: tape measure protein [Galbitalea sp.]|jgi:tape measure domain-containing protein